MRLTMLFVSITIGIGLSFEQAAWSQIAEQKSGTSVTADRRTFNNPDPEDTIWLDANSANSGATTQVISRLRASSKELKARIMDQSLEPVSRETYLLALGRTGAASDLIDFSQKLTLPEKHLLYSGIRTAIQRKDYGAAPLDPNRYSQNLSDLLKDAKLLPTNDEYDDRIVVFDELLFLLAEKAIQDKFPGAEEEARKVANYFSDRIARNEISKNSVDRYSGINKHAIRQFQAMGVRDIALPPSLREQPVPRTNSE